MNTPYLSVLLSILFLTGFVKIATTLSICKEGLGLRSSAISFAVLGLSIALSIITVEPFVQKSGGLDAFLNGVPFSQSESTFRPFLTKYTDSDVLQSLTQKSTSQAHLDETNASSSAVISFPRLVAAFMLSEFKKAFSVGLIILLPFLIIDIVVAQLLVVLSVTQIHQQVISLPIKLLLFVALDGWKLITEQLLKSFGAI